MEKYFSKIVWTIIFGIFFIPKTSAGSSPVMDTMTNLQSPEIVTQEIRYHMKEAAEVQLIWGINGWSNVGKELRPTGTYLKNRG